MVRSANECKDSFKQWKIVPFKYEKHEGCQEFQAPLYTFFSKCIFLLSSRGLQPLASDEKLNKHVFAKQTNDHICSAKNVKTIKD